MKTTIRVQDQYNENKVYIVKVYNCGHTYVNQEIKGDIIYSKFIKTTKSHLKEFLGIDIFKNTNTPNKVLDCTKIDNNHYEVEMKQHSDEITVGDIVTTECTEGNREVIKVHESLITVKTDNGFVSVPKDKVIEKLNNFSMNYITISQGLDGKRSKKTMVNIISRFYKK